MSNITLSDLPFVLQGDITNTTTQTPLYLIQNGDSLTGLSSISDVESDQGSLNITSIQLYNDIIELQNNQTVLVNAISEIDGGGSNNGGGGGSNNGNGSNTSDFTSASLTEYITGAWTFVSDTTFNTIITKNSIKFKNTYEVQRTLSLDNDINGLMRLDGQLAINDLLIKADAPPTPVEGYAILFLEDASTLSIMYENGAIFPIISTLGGGGAGNTTVTQVLNIEDFNLQTNSEFQFNYYEVDVFHGLNKSVTTPTFIDSDQNYIDAEYKYIDQDNIKMIIGEPMSGTLLIT